MDFLFDKLKELSEYFIEFDKVFQKHGNYSKNIDYDIYIENYNKLKEIASTQTNKKINYKRENPKKNEIINSSFADEIYSQFDRQMKLSDIIEYMLYSRGLYYLFTSNKFEQDKVEILIEISLRIVNILMIYETVTTDIPLRKKLLEKLKSKIQAEQGFEKLEKFDNVVGTPNSNADKEIKNYFDSLLPKTAGGLWHEILVFSFILKYDIGYIFSLLINQKPISLDSKLSPPDLIVLHKKTFRYYGVEIGSLKERQSGGFMTPSGLPVIPVDIRNARISDRCPECSKWIGICPKVIEDFSNTKQNIKPIDEIRCLTECNLFTLDEKLNGKCKYMKFNSGSKKWKGISTFENKHYHYKCCDTEKTKSIIQNDKNYHKLQVLNQLLYSKSGNKEQIEELQKELKSKFPILKTHSIYYPELLKLIKMNKN